MKTRKIFLITISIYILLIGNSFSQSVGIGASAFTPDPSAIIDVNSTTQGALIPRMTTTQRDAISSPAEALLIFNITTKCIEMYINNTWNTVSCPTNCVTPSAPTGGTHTSSQTGIVWNWNAVSGVTGYKWGTTNVYSAAIDNGISTSKTQTGFTCGTSNTLYVWAYSTCGNSAATMLTQTTSPCCTTGTLTDGNLTKTTICNDNNTVIKWAGASGGSTTWNVPAGVTQIEYLIVGGGGGGGGSSDLQYAGGGGGGGVLTGTNFAVTPEAGVSIIVGNGGSACTNGGNSSVIAGTTLTAIGGGKGGKRSENGGNGGCGGGGGGSWPSGPGSGGTGSQGYAGGNGNNSSEPGGGGGGGAGAIGSNGATRQGGNGGAGIASSITGAELWYAGGGGGGTESNGTVGQGANGGGNGGKTGDVTLATSGTADTGSGGGGGGITPGTGGSGIVIIKYTNP